MERSSPNRESIASVFDNLRWVLKGLEWGGIVDWPRSEPIADPGPQGDEPNEGRGSRAEREEVLLEIRSELTDCRRCRLHAERRSVVFGEGPAAADLVFVGEGPGLEEDRLGRPFVGKAGKLLDRMIRTLNLTREQVYICNTVKCRPPKNRVPNPDEIEICGPFLFRQLEALRPRVICALGACAAQTLLGAGRPISRLRGEIHKWRGIPLVCTYHPAYLLRNPAQKGASWRDLLLIRDVLNEDPKDNRCLSI